MQRKMRWNCKNVFAFAPGAPKEFMDPATEKKGAAKRNKKLILKELVHRPLCSQRPYTGQFLDSAIIMDN